MLFSNPIDLETYLHQELVNKGVSQINHRIW